MRRLLSNPTALAIGLALVLAIWLAMGDVRQSRETMDDPFEAQSESTPRVEVSVRESETFQPEVVLQGQIEPWRSVTLNAQVAGTVTRLPVGLGERVQQGTAVVELSADSRPEELAQAQAELERAEADLSGASRLRGENLASQSEYLARKADVTEARAKVKAARLALEDTRPEAPFDAIVNSLPVEEGQEVAQGDPLASLVQTERLKASGRVPQQKAGKLEVGQPVRVTLLDGRELRGTLTFVASAAHPETRSFEVEAALENPDGLRVAGSTATLRVGVESTKATRISPAYLNLDKQGKLGVKYVDQGHQVRFARVELISTDNDGAWVSGLPQRIRLITRGAGFVHPGETVVAVSSDSGNGD